MMVVDRSYLDTFDICEEVCQWFESDEDMYKLLDKAEADSAILAWRRLKNVCFENNLYEARELLTSKHFEGRLLVYLRNSTAMYYYFSGIKYQVLSQVDQALAQREIVNDLEFCLYISDIVVEKPSDSVYVPPHYWLLFSDYLVALVNAGKNRKAEALPEKLYRYCILDGMTENQADCRRCVLQARYICLTTDSKTALKTINQLYDRMSKDPELADDADNVKSILLGDITN